MIIRRVNNNWFIGTTEFRGKQVTYFGESPLTLCQKHARYIYQHSLH